LDRPRSRAGGNRKARRFRIAGGHRARNVRQERRRAVFSLGRSRPAESYRARKREQVALKTAGGPFMYVGLEMCDLAKAHALFAKVRSEHLSRMPDCTAWFSFLAELPCGT